MIHEQDCVLNGSLVKLWPAFIAGAGVNGAFVPEALAALSVNFTSNYVENVVAIARAIAMANLAALERSGPDYPTPIGVTIEFRSDWCEISFGGGRTAIELRFSPTRASLVCGWRELENDEDDVRISARRRFVAARAALEVAQ